MQSSSFFWPKSGAHFAPNDSIVWGVRRRSGYIEIDDPAAHGGLTQHAFPIGDYSFALCGFRPYGWRRPAHIRLAIATEDNPTCRECSEVIAFETTDVSPLELIQALTAPAGRYEPVAVASGIKYLLPGTIEAPIRPRRRARVRRKGLRLID